MVNEEKLRYGIKMMNRKGRSSNKEKREEGKRQWNLWRYLLASVKGSRLLRTRVECLVSWGVVPGRCLYVCLYVYQFSSNGVLTVTLLCFQPLPLISRVYHGKGAILLKFMYNIVNTKPIAQGQTHSSQIKVSERTFFLMAK